MLSIPRMTIRDKQSWFFSYFTQILNTSNLQLQGKMKRVADVISAINALKRKLLLRNLRMNKQALPCFPNVTIIKEGRQ